MPAPETFKRDANQVEALMLQKAHTDEIHSFLEALAKAASPDGAIKFVSTLRKVIIQIDYAKLAKKLPCCCGSSGAGGGL